MTSPLVVVTGVGTGIGKTHLAVSLLHAWAADGRRVAGYKPIESGVDGVSATDQDALDGAATFHVKHPRLELTLPVSPHLALRREGRHLHLERWVDHIAELRARCDGVVLELAGGAFSPLDDTRTNADLIAKFPDARVILVAVDRLGVLHDVIATVRALSHHTPPIQIHQVALHAPGSPDASTTTNAEELTRLTKIHVTTIPRANSAEIAARAAASQCLRSLL